MPSELQTATPRSITSKVPMTAIMTTVIGFAGAAVGGVMIEIGRRQGLSSGDVLRDVSAAFDLPSMAGAVTFLSVSLLVFTGAVTALAATLLPSGRLLVAIVSALSLIMAFDDQFLLHERDLPALTGLDEIFFLVPYALTGILILVLAWRNESIAGIAGLWPALVFMGLSLVTDLEIFAESSYATEDLLKIAGFSAWAAFWFYHCRRGLRRTGLAAGAAR